MLLKTKTIVIVAAFLLVSSGTALATTGQLPEAVGDAMKNLAVMTGIKDSEPQAEERDHGVANDATDVAKDENATGTMTLPNGKNIENHGLAVSEAARQLEEIAEWYRDANEQGSEERDQNGTPPAEPGPVVESEYQTEHIPDFEGVDDSAGQIPALPGRDAGQTAPGGNPVVMPR